MDMDIPAYLLDAESAGSEADYHRDAVTTTTKADRADRRLKEPPAPPKNKAEFLEYFDDIAPVLSTRCLVSGVIGEGTSVILYGDSNSGKTFGALDIALCIASGIPWQGREVRQVPVMYAALEGGAGFRNRVTAWKFEKHAPGNRVMFAALPVGLDLVSDDGDAGEVIRAALAMKERLGQPVGLIVIDTLSRAMAGGNENAPEDMGALVRHIDEIRAATGATVLVVHHSGKDAAKGARGHSLLRAAVDTELELTATEDGIRTLRATKQRDMECGASFGFRLNVVEVGFDPETAEPVTSCIPIPTDPKAKGKTEARLTPAQRGWLDDITDLLAGPETEMRVPVEGMKPIPTQTREQIRVGLRGKGRFETETHAPLTQKDRDRLRDALNQLKDKGKLGLTAELVWLL